MSRSTLYAIGIAAVALLALGSYYWFMQNQVPAGGQPMLPTESVTIGKATVVAEIANTDEERKTGLSGRSGLAEGHGMLFVFPKDGNWGIWMKEMKFSIDIVWADAGGKIVSIDANVSPETYPTVFYPNNPSRYVLELPAGYTAAHGVTVGSKITLPAQ